MANEDQYPSLTETQPSHPAIGVISDFLKKYTEKNAVDKFFLGDLQKLAETISYNEPLTTGKGETLHLKPETLSALNLLPQSKGGAAVAGIGPVGLRALAHTDPILWETATKLKNTLLKVPLKDWQTQKEIIEGVPGFFAVPRGRDYIGPEDIEKYGTTVKHGAEVPDTMLKPGALERAEGKLPDYFISPRHYEAYPQLKDFDVITQPHAAKNTGFMDYRNRRIGLGPAESAQDLLDTLNHEVTHAVQRFERWPYGTNFPEAAKRLVDIEGLDRAGVPLSRELTKQLDLARWLREAKGEEVISQGGKVSVPNIIAGNEYRRAAGEQLAEAVAQSARQGGGRIPHHYTQPISQMYDPYVLDRAIREAVDALNASAGLK